MNATDMSMKNDHYTSFLPHTAHRIATAAALHCMRSDLIRRSTRTKFFLFEATHRTSFCLETVTHKQLVRLRITHRKSIRLSVTHTKLLFFQGHPQSFLKVTELPTERCVCFVFVLCLSCVYFVCVLKLPTEKRFVSELPTENRNCLSLPTKEGFFEKVPTDERKRLGPTHI